MARYGGHIMAVPPLSHRPPGSPVWLLAMGVLFILGAGAVLEPVWAQDPDASGWTSTMAAGGTADSNGSMIAVTGVDMTGQSILYLIDTESQHICVYQATGGSKSTRGIEFVGARRIDLDLQLDGFNDKTESEGRPLRYKDLLKKFESAQDAGGR